MHLHQLNQPLLSNKLFYNSNWKIFSSSLLKLTEKCQNFFLNFPVSHRQFLKKLKVRTNEAKSTKTFRFFNLMRRSFFFSSIRCTALHSEKKCKSFFLLIDSSTDGSLFNFNSEWKIYVCWRIVIENEYTKHINLSLWSSVVTFICSHF